MHLEILNFENQVLKTIDTTVLDIQNIRHDLIHQVVLWQQLKKRRPISHTRGISEVKGSTRKIYKQKGTGRARHGSIRGAQFVGGGVIFGPTKDKVYNNKINKKIKNTALLNALALKVKEQSITIYETLKVKTTKSKDFLLVYGKNFLSKNAKSLLVDKSFDCSLSMSVKNHSSFNQLPSVGINVLDIIKHQKIYFSEKAFNEILGRFKK